MDKLAAAVNTDIASRDDRARAANNSVSDGVDAFIMSAGTGGKSTLFESTSGVSNVRQTARLRLETSPPFISSRRHDCRSFAMLETVEARSESGVG